MAKLAKVDPSTASRVLRDDPIQKARQDTRERILEAAKMLDYRPNAMAQGLRTQRTDIFALVIPTLDKPSFVDIVRGIQMEAAEREKLVVVVETDAIGGGEEAGSARAEMLTRLAADGRLDGIVIASATPEDLIVTRLAERDVPLVRINEAADAATGWRAFDDEKGAEVAVEYLRSLGHRDIGFVGFGEFSDTGRRRESGFRAAMAAAGLDVDGHWVVSADPSEEEARAATEGLLADTRKGARPTAIISASLFGALGVLDALKGASIAVPDQMSVIALADHDLAETTDPPLTAVRFPHVQMGREALRRAIGAVENRERAEITIQASVDVVVRQSTAAPAPGPGSRPAAPPASPAG